MDLVITLHLPPARGRSGVRGTVHEATCRHAGRAESFDTWVATVGANHARSKIAVGSVSACRVCKPTIPRPEEPLYLNPGEGWHS